MFTDRVIQYLGTVLVIKAGRDFFAIKPVPAVVHPVQCVTMATDLATKPLGSVFASQDTKEALAWSLVKLVTMVKTVRGGVIALMAHFVIT